MDIDQIDQAVNSFGSAAARLKEAGYDGIEIMGDGGMLVHEFLSPVYNKRSDEYGGSLQNRLRFPLQVIGSIRDAIGHDMVLGFKICADEFTTGGMNLDDAKEIARQLEGDGRLDYFNTAAGIDIQAAAHVPPTYYPPGCFVYLSAALKETVQLPVFAMGRINDPVQAEKILKDGQADVIAMVRALICDPELPNKAREGRTEEIRHCIGCEEGCYGRLRRARLPSTCAINPEAGKEKEMAIVPATIKKRVLVIGGGPAGLEAARVAAFRGHEVALFEKEPQLGGQANIAAKAPGRDDFAEIPRYYAYQLQMLGVKIHLDTEADEENINNVSPEAVVIATGSLPLSLGVPILDGANVVELQDVLQDKVVTGENVVVVAGENGNQALSVADYLAEQGKRVEVLNEALYAGSELPFCTLQSIYTRLLYKGVVLTPLVRVKEIKGNTVVVYNIFTEMERHIEGIDTVVQAMGGKANNDLFYSLKRSFKETYAVGDCLSQRGLLDAVLDGARVGRQI
jgi:thioredoxin reductase